MELIEANPNYAHIRFPDGGEDTEYHITPPCEMSEEQTPESS